MPWLLRLRVNLLPVHTSNMSFIVLSQCSSTCMGTLQTLLVLWWQTCYLRANNKPYFCMMVAHKALICEHSLYISPLGCTTTRKPATMAVPWVAMFPFRRRARHHAAFSTEIVPVSEAGAPPCSFQKQECSRSTANQPFPEFKRLFPEFKRGCSDNATAPVSAIHARQTSTL